LPYHFEVFGRIAQPEIGRQIDDAQILRQPGDHRLAGGMGQGAEHQIDAGQIHLLDALQRRQIHMRQMREHLAHGHAGLAVARQAGDAHRRMRGDDPHQLGAGVSAGSQHRDPVAHGWLSFPQDAPTALWRAARAGSSPGRRADVAVASMPRWRPRAAARHRAAGRMASQISAPPASTRNGSMEC
jgi:hypothetical protein